MQIPLLFSMSANGIAATVFNNVFTTGNCQKVNLIIDISKFVDALINVILN
jgi:hypothetical protein